MGSALRRPNLPAHSVTLCAVGKMFEFAAEALERRGVKVLSLSPDKRLRYTLCHHADMLICHVGGEEVVCGSAENARTVAAAGLTAIPAQKIPQPSYPSDTYLHQLIIGHFSAGHRDLCDPAVLDALSRQGIPFFDIRRGAVRCAAAIVSEKALITADFSVAKAAVKAGIDVLVIRPGYIELSDYRYGFIGGCCGLAAPDRMLFTGDIFRHPDGERMVAFMRKYHVSADCLSGGELIDIGGMLPLTEA